MQDDNTALYNSPEPGVQTELINPQEIASFAQVAPQPEPAPHHDEDHPMYVRMVIGSLIVLGIFILGVGAVMAFHHHRQQELAQYRTQCEQALQSLGQKKAAYQELLEGDAAQAGQISDMQVDDAQTVELLDQQLNATVPETVTCSVSDVSQYQQRIQTIQEHDEWYTTHTASLQEAIDQVTASKYQKDLNDRIETFSGTVSEVQTLLDATSGNVADVETWNKLYTLQGKAQDALNKQDLEQMIALETQMRSAMEEVAASRDQKIADDERKAAEQQEKADEEKAKKEKLEKAKEEFEEAWQKADNKTRKELEKIWEDALQSFQD